MLKCNSQCSGQHGSYLRLVHRLGLRLRLRLWLRLWLLFWLLRLSQVCQGASMYAAPVLDLVPALKRLGTTLFPASVPDVCCMYQCLWAVTKQQCGKTGAHLLARIWAMRFATASLAAWRLAAAMSIAGCCRLCLPGACSCSMPVWPLAPEAEGLSALCHTALGLLTVLSGVHLLLHPVEAALGLGKRVMEARKLGEPVAAPKGASFRAPGQGVLLAVTTAYTF